MVFETATDSDDAVTRVLLVEDEWKLRKTIAEGLGMENWDVATAADGAEALRLVDTGSFELIVLDLMLPDIDGTEVIKRVRSHAPKLPILIITAGDVRGIENVTSRDGATEFLQKPFGFMDLLARCHALLRSHPRE